MGVHFLIWSIRKIFVMELTGFAEIDLFLTPAPVILFLEEKHILQHHHKYEVIRDCV